MRQSKKKAFVALPALDAAEPSLPWSVAFTQRLGRHGVAKRDIMAGAIFKAVEHLFPVQVRQLLSRLSSMGFSLYISVWRKMSAAGMWPSMLS